MYRIGDIVSGSIEWVNLDKKKFPTYGFKDTKDSVIWSCFIKWDKNSKLKDEIEGALRVGNTIKGLILFINYSYKHLTIGLSDFGLIEPKTHVINTYINYLTKAKELLNDFTSYYEESGCFEMLYNIKRLLLKCVLRRDSDWVIVYKAFSFEREGDAAEYVKYIDNILKVFIKFKENKLSKEKFKILSSDSIHELLSQNFIYKIDKAIIFFRNIDTQKETEFKRIKNYLENKGDRKAIPKINITNSDNCNTNIIVQKNSDSNENLNINGESFKNDLSEIRCFKPDEMDIDVTEDDAGFPEGKKKLKQHVCRERNPRVIRLAKDRFKARYGKLQCEVCGFCFEDKYGEIGEDYIEGHHSIPVSEIPEDYKTKPEDIILVCSNCHRMLHRKRPWLKKEQLKKLIKY